MFATNCNKPGNKPQQTRAPELLEHRRSEARSFGGGGHEVFATNHNKQYHYGGGWEVVCNKSPQTKAPRPWDIDVRKQDHYGGGWHEVLQHKADTRFATNHKKPDLQDAVTWAFGNRITIVEADTQLTTNCNKPVQQSTPQITTHQSSRIAGT